MALVDRLDPDHEPGRLTLITRMGAGLVRDRLPAVVEKVEASGHPVVWICDPMHGNTFESARGYKTRSLRRRGRGGARLLRGAPGLGTHPGGIHIELTGDDVTECIGGADGLDRGRPRRTLRDRLRPAAEPPAVPRARLPRRGDPRLGLTSRAGHDPEGRRTGHQFLPRVGKAVRSEIRQPYVGAAGHDGAHERAADFETAYRAVQGRDPRFDGRLYLGVTSTGIYCRPSCPARTPKPANVRFYATAAAAVAAGFRACKRCRPDALPGQSCLGPPW